MATTAKLRWALSACPVWEKTGEQQPVSDFPGGVFFICDDDVRYGAFEFFSNHLHSLLWRVGPNASAARALTIVQCSLNAVSVCANSIARVPEGISFNSDFSAAAAKGRVSLSVRLATTTGRGWRGGGSAPAQYCPVANRRTFGCSWLRT